MAAGKRFEELPMEILSLILEATPDLTTLQNLILAGPAFYRAYLGQDSRIIGAVVANEVSRDLLPEAVAVLRAARINQHDKDSVRAFLKQYHDDRQSLTDRKWTAQEAAEITNIHEICIAFASDFASEALSRFILTHGENPNEEPATELELLRIKRNFYRFELYCNVFREKVLFQSRESRFDLEEQAEIYWPEYAPWENEQFASIHDYLIRRLSIPYNEMVIHDTEWGEESVQLDDPDDFGRQYLLSRGLTFLKTLFETSTYNEWRKMIEFGSDDLFIHRTMQFHGHGMYDLDDDSNEGDTWGMEKSFWKESDGGPRESWKWAHFSYLPDEPYYLDETYDLRARGYCFWDWERIQRWCLKLADPTKRRILDKVEFARPDHRLSYEELRETWRLRSEIWIQGGRGWWAKDDESKIEWLYGSPAERAEQERANEKTGWGVSKRFLESVPSLRDRVEELEKGARDTKREDGG